MTIIQSDWATGRKTANRPQTAGAVHTTLFQIPLAGAVAVGDIVEIGYISSYATVVDAKLIPTGAFGAGVTADVGLMSGVLGSTDAARTVANELFAAAALTAMQTLSKPDALLLTSTDLPRAIGIKFSAALAAAAGRTLTLLLFYRQ